MNEETEYFKYPREIEFVGELPKTVSGKTRRFELRQRQGGRGAQAASPATSGAEGRIPVKVTKISPKSTRPPSPGLTGWCP